MRSRRLIPLAAVLAAVALAGCGSDTPADDAKSAYESVQTSVDELGDIRRTLGEAQRVGIDRTRDALDQLSREADEAADRLRAVDVSADLRDERDALNDALEESGRAIDDAVVAITNRDTQALLDATREVVTSSELVRRARDAFERALDAATR